VQCHQGFCIHCHSPFRRRSLELRVGSRCTIERCGPRARYLAGAPTRSRTQPAAIVVALAPGAKSASHRHAGIVFAYVLEGPVRSQLNGGDVIEYSAGQSWVEPPGTVHTHKENPSQTVPARLLAVFIAPTGAQLTSVDK
jgi:quercetin dioxygenase-like cupin family protein